MKCTENLIYSKFSLDKRYSLNIWGDVWGYSISTTVLLDKIIFPLFVYILFDDLIILDKTILKSSFTWNSYKNYNDVRCSVGSDAYNILDRHSKIYKKSILANGNNRILAIDFTRPDGN